MPEIRLATRDPEKELVLSEFEQYRCLVNVVSGGFSYQGCMSFDNLAEFVRQVSAAEQLLSGTAILREDFHDHYLKMEVTKLGHVVVSGAIIEYGEHIQRLEFEFVTDQTCLPQFAKQLGSLIEHKS